MRLTWLAAARGYARRLVHPEPSFGQSTEQSSGQSSGQTADTTARRTLRDELYRASRAARE